MSVRPILAALASSLLVAACDRAPASAPSYLFVWAGDSAETANDFLGVIDATPTSPTYGAIVASIATDAAGTHPHHTELVMPAIGHLLANGFHAGRTWLFDLTRPTQPAILTSFGDVGGYSHPHTFTRLPNGHLIASFQYAAAGEGGDHAHGATGASVLHQSGGLVELDERGTLVRAGSARDTSIRDPRLYPYSPLVLASMDRALSTTTDMDHADTIATAEWVQLWRWSDLSLLKSIALPPGPRGTEHKLTGEPFLLANGKDVYVHTFSCGLYLLRGLEGDAPTATFVHGFPGFGCGVPVVTGHWYLQPIPDTHSLVALDITDPTRPREVSSVSFGETEHPHWLSIDGTGRRLVLNSGGGGERLFVINFDPASGRLAIDSTFRDKGATVPGVSMRGAAWPHGFRGFAQPHGTVFSR